MINLICFGLLFYWGTNWLKLQCMNKTTFISPRGNIIIILIQSTLLSTNRNSQPAVDKTPLNFIVTQSESDDDKSVGKFSVFIISPKT